MILKSEKLNSEDIINKYVHEYEIFSSRFSEKEMEFYSLIESDEDIYKDSIAATYDLFKD
ncbi:MAG: hypothetical protein FWH29_02855 [Methanobrevibacter sp.]|nr:hypothetical protein [Methanobrevibacter sp.]